MDIFIKYQLARLKIKVLLLLLTITFSCANEITPLKPGSPAADFTLQAIDGSSFQASTLRGTKILLHFWADWCTECRAEFPKLQKSHLLLEDQNFKIIAINVGQTEKHVKSFVDHYGLTFPMLMDPDMTVSQLYRIKGLPASILINSDFTIQQSHLGWLDEKLILQMKENMK